MSKRLFVSLAVLLVLAGGCKRGRKVSKGDMPADLNSVQAYSEALQKNAIQYQWLRIKAGLTYEDSDNSYSASAQLKLQKDRLIWGSVTMLIELVRAQINQDSATFLNRTAKEYSSVPVKDLQQMLAIEGLDLSALQRLLIAQPPFGINKESKLVSKAEEAYTIDYISVSFKERISIAPAATHLTSYRYERNQSEYLEVNYSDFTEIDGRTLPKKIDMHIAQAAKKIRIILDVSDYTFLDTDEAPFSIPSSYKRTK